MARRLSSILGLAKDDQHDPTTIPEVPPLNYSANSSPRGSPAMGLLAKHKTISKTPSLLDLAASNAALPPPPLVTDMGVRPGSRDSRRSSRAESHGTRDSSGSRPTTPTYLTPNSPSLGPIAGKLAKRKTWMPGRSDKHEHGTDEPTSTEAWIAGLKEHVSYDMHPLLYGGRVEELWDPDGDVDVYLFPQTTGRGPSFRVSSTLFADSQFLRHHHDPPHTNGSVPAINLPIAELDASAKSLSLRDRPNSIARKPLAKSQTVPNFSVPHPSMPLQQPIPAYMPLDLAGDYSTPASVPKGDDVELLVLYRNFMSFLNGGALISTPRQNSLYAIFMGISSILRKLRFGNEKGSSWGAVPWSSFSKYTEELRLADVRHSREKNIEAIVLGEAMRSWPLYNEGFVHAVGRLGDIRAIKSPKFDKISPIVVNRLERANLDLQHRLSAVRVKLDNFDFPMMFAGIANSQTATESKLVRFKAWKLAFMDFRAFIMSTYKKKYGAWPPKASSKKNNFEESGLNHLLLKDVYQDFCDLYDMLVDRHNLTPRTIDMPTIAEDATSGSNETIQHALRSVESEYDRSVPPVNPVIPFDVPLLPTFASSFNRDHILSKHDPNNSKKLKESEINALLLGSYNRESVKPTLMCQNFVEYERKMGAGKTVQELIDLRCGQWLLLYAVLQALPMTVVDARDLRFTEGCEYFLCMAPRGGRPWMMDDTSTSRAWYNVASGGGLISLPADLIDHSVEGIYRRSHCWQIANKWADSLPIPPVNFTQPSYQPVGRQLDTKNLSPFLTPTTANLSAESPSASPLLYPQPGMGLADPGMISLHGSGLAHRRTSMNIGLEEVPSPDQSHIRQTSITNPNITFDDILGASPPKGKKGKRK